MAETQAHRHIAVTTPLGPDVLLLNRMQGRESLSGLFEFTLDLLSRNDTIDPVALLGKTMTVELVLPNRKTRYFNGYVSRFAHTGWEYDFACYRATLRPWLWLLTRTADCRIFQQERTVPEIIKKVFQDLGGFPVEDNTSGGFRQREYTVQYRETAFDFVSRLMEQEGIYYYFKHDKGKHVLVLANSVQSHDNFPGYASVPYYSNVRMRPAGYDGLTRWSAEQELETGKFVYRDFDFESPRKDLTAVLDRPLQNAEGHHEIFDYPGGYADHSDGDAYARIRLEELQAQHEICSGAGDSRGLAPGYLFSLKDHPVVRQNRRYLVVSASYEATAAPYHTVIGAEAAESFTCSISAIDASLPYRPPRITPKPVVQGLQTAIVVGGSGAEIWTDKHGRVKVQFHWDRRGGKDENSSCWLRVAQVWAGKQWGGMYLPRIGQEVIVDFLEGDPDRPIVTGRVYNGDNIPPYPLDQNRTVSTLKSNSTGGGGGFNELRFEDKKDSEEVYLHAEKDLNSVVKHDDTLKVGHDQTIEIKNDRTETVSEGNEKVTIAKGNRTVEISMGNDTLKVAMGNHSIKVAMGSSTIEAMEAIELKVGASSIRIDQSGVTIKGMMITVSGDTMTEVKGALVDVTGDLVQINS